jgi:fructose-1,6-bisphosphatase I
MSKLQRLNGFQGSDDVMSVIGALAAAGGEVAKALRSGSDAAGETGRTNVQGESVKQMDQIADNIFTRFLRSASGCGSIISEEQEVELPVGKGLLVAIDPLDGSSNLDSTVPVGSIFGVYSGDADRWTNALDFGVKIVAAGFVSYGIVPAMYIVGSSTVTQYRLDWSSDCWKLSKDGLMMPAKPGVFSCNEGNSEKWSRQDRDFLLATRTQIGSCRYAGSLVADCEKILMKGGLFAYPSDSKSPDGKLRLFYECLPMAAIVTAAGGAASDGRKAIFNVEQKSIHQRSPLFIGSRSILEARLG